MRASPAAARGTRKMKKRQATVAISVSPGGHGDYPFSSRGIEWDRKTRINPRASTAMPAKTKPAREAGDARSTIAASTRNHPASNSKKPTNLHSESPRSEQMDSPWHSRCRLKYHNHPESIAWFRTSRYSQARSRISVRPFQGATHRNAARAAYDPFRMHEIEGTNGCAELHSRKELRKLVNGLAPFAANEKSPHNLL